MTNTYHGLVEQTFNFPQEGFNVKDGYLQFNGKPGLGITLDEKLVKEKYMVAGETWWV